MTTVHVTVGGRHTVESAVAPLLFQFACGPAGPNGELRPTRVDLAAVEQRAREVATRHCSARLAWLDEALARAHALDARREVLVEHVRRQFVAAHFAQPDLFGSGVRRPATTAGDERACACLAAARIGGSGDVDRPAALVARRARAPMNGQAPAVLRGPLVSESFARALLASRRSSLPRHEAEAQARAFAAFQRWWRRQAGSHGPATSPRALHETSAVSLIDLLGYRRMAHTELARPGYVAGLVAAGARSRAAVLTAPWNAHLDHAWRDAVTLGTQAQVPWCLAFNGVSLRIVDAARPFARRHVEIDLAAAAASPSAFALMWLVARASSLRAETSGAGLDGLAASSAHHQTLVRTALDRGVRDAYRRIAAALAPVVRRTQAAGGPPATEEALTLVFRLLFLLYVESRGLAPLHHAIYRDGYSIAALRSAALDGRSCGLWPALRASMRLAHSGCRVRGLQVTAYNGRLFSPAHTPLVERVHLKDEVVRAVVAGVATRTDKGGATHAVSYAELGVEQLGAIYERLMDVDPGVEAPDEPGADARHSAAAGSPPSRGIDSRAGPVKRAGGSRRRASGSPRKATGSFYTPRALTDFVVRRTLAPLVVHRRADDLLRLRVLDPAMGSGAFLVSACRFLAGAYERALVREGAFRSSDFTARDRADFRRLVAQRCLYGVDLNPMAVQLARLSLWLTTLAADRPLTFLDHRLQAGDSLVGASSQDIARQPPGRGARRRQPDVLPLLAGLDMLRPIGASVNARHRMATVPDDDAGAVRDKERALQALDAEDGPLAAWRQAADTWCGAWFWPERPLPSAGVFSDLVASALGAAAALRPHQRARLAQTVRDVSTRQRFFHWTLTFPEVFADASGAPRDDAGFDAIVGNPPWDMLRAEDGQRADAVRHLVSFVRESGLYTTGGEAHANRFHLFVERSLDLLRPGGRLGLITPWGLFGDAGAAGVRRRMLDRSALDAIVVFDNRRAIFPIHRSIAFAASTCTRGPATRAIAVRPAGADVDVLDAVADVGTPGTDFPVTVTRTALDRLAPRDLACPAVRSSRDLARLLRLAEEFPAAADPAGWGVRFGRELNATDDRHRFRSGVPGCVVIEGKHVSPFVARPDPASPVVPHDVVRTLRISDAVQRSRVAYRDVAAPGNRLTLIAAVLPSGVVSTHTLFVEKTLIDAAAQRVLCALLNSLVANWFVRHWVSTHVTTALVHRLPLPCPAPSAPSFSVLASLARRCEAEGADGESYVTLQVECARLYRIDPDDLGEVLESFPLIDADLRRRVAEGFHRASAPPRV